MVSCVDRGRIEGKTALQTLPPFKNADGDPRKIQHVSFLRRLPNKTGVVLNGVHARRRRNIFRRSVFRISRI